jgi:hypothetical protein
MKDLLSLPDVKVNNGKKSAFLNSGVLAPVCQGRPPEKLAPPQLLTHKVLSNQFSHIICRGYGGILPRKILKFRTSETAFPAI